MRPIKRCFVMLCDAYKTAFKTCTPKARKHTQVMNAMHRQCVLLKIRSNAAEENLFVPISPTLPRTTTCYEVYPWAHRHYIY